MLKKSVVLSILISISILFTGCLVMDESTDIGTDDEKKIKLKAKNITANFFSYNEYDSTADNPGYNAEELINLLEDRGKSDILTIDPIIGSDYDKSYDKLAQEVRDQKTIFKAQVDHNYKLLFEQPTGEPSYKGNYNSGDYTSTTAVYDVAFQVFEEYNGKRLLTDNGTITFELAVNEDNKWKINYMTINYKELGEVSLN
ncbi:hypothetical protein JCM16358_13080 [Halanaerocella petrolearia]